MRQSSHVLLALAACCACAALVAAQADPNWVDPNLQTEGFSASMTAAAIAGNPLGLTPAVVQAEGMDLPNGGMTFASQHNAEKSDDAANLWSWEFGAYNVENVGLTTVHNLKDPSWPVVMTLFQSESSPDFYPVVNGQISKQELARLATTIGYPDIFAATNAGALGVVSRMGADPTQAIFGVLGQDGGESVLEGGVDMPITDDTLMDMTPEEIAALPKPSELKPEPSSEPEIEPPSTFVEVVIPEGTTAPVTSAPTATPAPTNAPATRPAAPKPSAAPSPAPAPKPPVAPSRAPPPKSSAAALRAGAAVFACLAAGLFMLA